MVRLFTSSLLLKTSLFISLHLPLSLQTIQTEKSQQETSQEISFYEPLPPSRNCNISKEISEFTINVMIQDRKVNEYKRRGGITNQGNKVIQMLFETLCDSIFVITMRSQRESTDTWRFHQIFKNTEPPLFLENILQDLHK
jgi:hypothetical protein